MRAYLFPGQGAQFVGMGKDLYENNELAKRLFDQANDILGFNITEVMFEGSEEALKQTNITQPAIFLHSTISAKINSDNFHPDVVAGHSLGEFSALVASQALNFEDGLRLVQARANAMQKACEHQESTMAAIVGMDDEIVEKVCKEIADVVVPANYNCPGQLVISGTIAGIEKAVDKLKELGARRAIVLPVGGAFHSPLMASAKTELKAAIEQTKFNTPICPIYQNVIAAPETNCDQIKYNLIEQLTAPVRWTQTLQNMIAGGVTHFTEVGGKGRVLLGMVKKVDRKIPADMI